jgi:AraC-like DNA-binding protein
MVHTLDWALRAGVISLLLFVAALLLRDRPHVLRARVAAAFAVSTAAYALYFAPGFAAPPTWWQLPLVALSTGNMALFWIFSCALFNDDFRVRWWHAAAWGALATVAVINCVLLAGAHPRWAGTVGTGLDFAALIFAVLAVAQSITSWRDDLVERRRRLRLIIVVAGSIYTVMTTWARFGIRPGTAGEGTSLGDVFVLAAIVVLAAWRLVRISERSELAAEPAATPANDAVAIRATTKPVEEPAIDPAEEALVARLQAEMSVERAYRREHLTIGTLAGQLGLQEYRLRRCINQRLGYRNFNAFLNHYRIEAAKRVLADPVRADVPVLTIAIDVGFQSLGPFNRAFKATTGLTPTEFRRLGRHAPPERATLTLADSEIG